MNSARENSGASWLSSWWPAIVWAILISAFSTGVFSSEHTSRYILPLLQWIFPHASHHTLALLHHLLRKGGHVGEYFVLSLFLLRGIRAGRREAHLTWALLVITMVAGYAALDEWHQSWTPGRGSLELSDILLDTTAGAGGQIIAAVAVLALRKRERPAPKPEILAAK
ncbi:MAG: VanZ family protein [Acidobacteriia bacterium]|nr:VanZ family protein [Terriglobia bacterium]